MTSSVAWALRWLVFVIVALAGLGLYVFPPRFSGPLSPLEREGQQRGRMRALLVRYGPLSLALFGAGLLLPAGGCPERIEYTSLTAGGLAAELASDPSARFACEVETILAHASELAGGAAPQREHLRAALETHAPELGCETERSSSALALPSAELIESLEITLLLIHARAGRLESARVRPGPLYSEFDAWAVAATVLDQWTDFELEVPARSEPAIFRLDRAQITKSGEIGVWAIASISAICADPPEAQLFVNGQPRPCRLEPASFEERCTSARDEMLAVHVGLECDADEAAEGPLELSWGAAPKVPVSSSRPVRVAVEGDPQLWETARELAERDRRATSFGRELQAWGYGLPDLDPSSMIHLDLSHDDRIELYTEPSACEGPRLRADALASGPFSFAGIVPDDTERGTLAVEVRAGCITVPVSPKILAGPSYDADDRYEPTTFYAATATIAWATSCVASGCQSGPAVPPTGGRALPLLSRSELEALSSSWAELLGLLMLGLSLCTLALRHLHDLRPDERGAIASK